MAINSYFHNIDICNTSRNATWHIKYYTLLTYISVASIYVYTYSLFGINIILKRWRKNKKESRQLNLNLLWIPFIFFLIHVKSKFHSHDHSVWKKNHVYHCSYVIYTICIALMANCFHLHVFCAIECQWIGF